MVVLRDAADTRMLEDIRIMKIKPTVITTFVTPKLKFFVAKSVIIPRVQNPYLKS